MENHRGPTCGLSCLINFISDLGGVTLVKFANDTKLGGTANALESKATIQRHLGRVEEWGPCAVQHRERPSLAPAKSEPEAVVQARYCLPGQQLCGKVLGVLGDSELHRSHSGAGSSKGHQNEALQKQPQDQEIEGSGDPP